MLVPMNFVCQEVNTIVCQSTSLQKLAVIRHCEQEGLQPSLVALFKTASSSAQKVLLLCIGFISTEVDVLEIDLKVVDLKVDQKNLRLVNLTEVSLQNSHNQWKCGCNKVIPAVMLRWMMSIKRTTEIYFVKRLKRLNNQTRFD